MCAEHNTMLRSPSDRMSLIETNVEQLSGIFTVQLQHMSEQISELRDYCRRHVSNLEERQRKIEDAHLRISSIAKGALWLAGALGTLAGLAISYLTKFLG